MLVAAGGCTRLVALPDESVAGVALCKKDASHNLAHVLRLLLLGHKKRDRLGFPQPTSNSFFLELSGSLSLQVDVSRQIAKDRVSRAELMTGGGHRMYASANLGRLVLSCIHVEFCKQVLV